MMPPRAILAAVTMALPGVGTRLDIPLRVESGSVPEVIAAAAMQAPGHHPILVLGRHVRGSRRGVPGATACRVLGLSKED